MPGRKLPLLPKDKKVLRVFFTGPIEVNYMQLLAEWKSTQKISEELTESSDKILKNLKKLHGFDFLFAKTVFTDNKKPWHYWAINREGIYYILSTLTHEKLVLFLKSNEKIIKEFGDILLMVQKNDVQVSYLTRRIKNIVDKNEFDLLKNFIENWRGKNIPAEHSMLRFFSPGEEKLRDKIILQKYHIDPEEYYTDRVNLKIIDGFVERNDLL